MIMPTSFSEFCRLLIMFGMLLLAVSKTAVADDTTDRPNVVLIYADDWRWDCLGVVQREQGERARFPWLETPRLDKLAKESLRFRNAFVVNSLCSPGRACVLTGQYSHANGIIGNQQPMRKDIPTLATRLKEAGYNTAYCGKFHMDGQRDRPGFDFVASFIGQGRYNNCPILLNGQHIPTTGWIDDVSTDFAIEFLEKQTANKPFFLFLGFKSPHGPRGGVHLPPRVRERYQNEDSRPSPNAGLKAIFQPAQNEHEPPAAPPTHRAAEAHRAYMRHITAIDDCIGRVMDALEQTGQAENTYVFVTSDNGYYLGEHNLGDKRSAYEESIRVPLLVREPNSSGARGTRDQMVLNIDLAPTILQLADAQPLPDMHGISMLPHFAGRGDGRKAFLYEYFKEPKYTSPTVLAVRTRTHKLIKYPGHDEWTEVFDLENDPYETKNLADDAELLGRLQQEYDAQLSQVNFKMPELREGAQPSSNRRRRANR